MFTVKYVRNVKAKGSKLLWQFNQWFQTKDRVKRVNVYFWMLYCIKKKKKIIINHNNIIVITIHMVLWPIKNKYNINQLSEFYIAMSSNNSNFHSND